MTLPVQSINVKSSPYNAQGDGVTDDTSAIQAALDAATAGSIPSYGTVTTEVFFPPGLYLVSGLVTTNTRPSGPRLRGTSLHNTVIKAITGSTKPILDVGGPNAGDGGPFYHVSDLQFLCDGMVGTNPGVRVRRADRSFFERIYVASAPTVGMLVVDSTAVLREVEVFSSGTDGLVLDACQNVHVEHAFLNNNKGVGAKVVLQHQSVNPVYPVTVDAMFVTFRECHFEQNQVCQVVLNNVKHVRLRDNWYQQYSLGTPPSIQVQGQCADLQLDGEYEYGGTQVFVQTPTTDDLLSHRKE